MFVQLERIVNVPLGWDRGGCGGNVRNEGMYDL